MIASLPMYDMPHARAANDRLWSAVAAQLPGAPEALTRPDDLWAVWQDDDLLLAQTCGLPLKARLDGAVTLVGTPDYGLEGCPPGHYRSVAVVAADSPHTDPAVLAQARLAFNDPLSQSGWGNARALGLGAGEALETGAHAASAAAVADGRADVAAIDALTWRMLQREDPALTGALRVIGASPPVPATPFITARHRDPAPIAAALRAAIAALSAEDRETLSLRALIDIPLGAYRALPLPAPPFLS